MVPEERALAFAAADSAAAAGENYQTGDLRQDPAFDFAGMNHPTAGYSDYTWRLPSLVWPLTAIADYIRCDPRHLCRPHSPL